MAASMMNRNTTSASFEQEIDANSALTEVDKALRSGQIGLQCEAVVKFPRLFEKYPFPILINSAMLKIADVFRVGNNFIRLCILQVAQQSEKHLNKIFSVDEFTRRIFGVIHSNDPVARAITLRILGSVASIIAEKKSVHHSIISFLDSHNAVEVEAAIFAAQKFSEVSKTFSANVCSKIGAKIAGLETPSEMKLGLIPILKHMSHDTDTASKALGLCQSVLEAYPAQSFVVLTLRTMTQLTIHSLIKLQNHVNRLLTYLTTDPRQGVKAVCLVDMKLLAHRAAYLWTIQNLEDVAKFALDTSVIGLKVRTIHVLNAVCADVAISLLHIHPESTLLEVCHEFCYHSNTALSSQAVRLLTHLAKYKCFPAETTMEAVGAIQTQLVLLSSDESRSSSAQLKLVLKCAADVCQFKPDVSPKIVHTLASLLALAGEDSQLSVCECLAAIGAHSPGAIDAISPSILASLTAAISDTSKEITQVQVHMCTLLFQAGSQRPMSGLIAGQVLSCTERASHWIGYKVARQAMRYCQYQVAYDILDTIKHQVVTEQVHNWLLGLQHACAAENKLKSATNENTSIIPCLEESIQFYVKSQVAMKAASTPNTPVEFACGFIGVRTRVLQAHQFLLLTCVSFGTKPPPVIATAMSANNGQEGTRWTQVVQQLEKCLKEYQAASSLAFNLYKSSFDADPTSLLNVNVIQQCCDCMKSVISTIISTIHTGQSNLGERQFLIKDMETESEAPSSPKGSSLSGSSQTTPSSSAAGTQSASCPSVSAMLKVMHDISAAMDKLLPETNTPVTISYKLMDILSWSVYSFIHASPSFPRFLFQTLQSTVVKLAISPQQGPSQEPVLIRADTHLSLRVEGVVQRGERPDLFRSVHSVTISVSTNLVSRSNMPNPNIKSNEVLSVQLSQTVQPHNDYFSTSFVLPFAVLGVHVIKVEAGVVDENGVPWCTGPLTTVTVKSYDENLQRQQQHQQQQMRAQASRIQQAHPSTSQHGYLATMTAAATHT